LGEKNEKIFVSVMSRHIQYKEVWLSRKLSDKIANFANPNCDLYVLGDININLLNVANENRVWYLLLPCF